jgi:hypothetical protein
MRFFCFVIFMIFCCCSCIHNVEYVARKVNSATDEEGKNRVQSLDLVAICPYCKEYADYKSGRCHNCQKIYIWQPYPTCPYCSRDHNFKKNSDCLYCRQLFYSYREKLENQDQVLKLDEWDYPYK